MKKYDSYKDSGVEWFGEIPSNWSISKIKYITKKKVTDGPHETPVFVDEGVPFLSVDGIQNGKLVFNNCRYISREDHERYIKKCKPEKNDILMGKAASTGKIAIVDKDIEFSIWSPLALIKPKNDTINPKFLEFIMKSEEVQYEIDCLCTSNTQKNISMDDIVNIQITLPPIKEQDSIAKYLNRRTSEIDNLIGSKEELIETLKKYRQSLITEVVTKGIDPNVKMKDSGIEYIGEIPEHWNKIKVKHLLKSGKEGIRIGPFGSSLKLDEMNELYTYKVYGQENLIQRSFKVGHRFINEEKFNTMKQYEIKEGDILVSMMGTVGKCQVVPRGVQKGIIDSHLIKMRVNKDLIDPNFLRLVIDESNYIRQSLNIQSKGSIMEGLNSTIIKNLLVILPTLEEQRSILMYLDCKINEVDTLIEMINDQIQILKDYRQSLIFEAVTGKIDVR